MIGEDGGGYPYFQQKVREVIGLDLSGYRPEQMQRRLRNFLQRFPGESFYTLGRRLGQDGALAIQVRDLLTINVTEFFRNPERYRQLEGQILPQLGRNPRVWSAGCSIGAEPYSLAISLLEICGGRGSVWATDVDPLALERAQRGVYRTSELRPVEASRLLRYFDAEGNDYAVCPAVRRMVTFGRHDLLRDPFPGPWDLIVCRNVVIYFTEAARAKLFGGFHDALRAGGVLFVGGTESLLDAARLGFESLAPFFYRRAA